MKSTDDQGLIPVIVASEADSTYIRTIPTAQATTGDGSVSLDLGLPPECATAVAAGGKRPEMKDMNGIWNLFSRAIQSLQAYRGVYNASFATAIGGYPEYALVSDSSGNYWISTADDNVTVPGADGASWATLQQPGRRNIISFTHSQNWTVPSGVTNIFAKFWGAGGAGGLGVNNGAGAGGNGGQFVEVSLAVSPGQSIWISVGAGGAPSSVAGTESTAGGDSTVAGIAARGGTPGGEGNGTYGLSNANRPAAAVSNGIALAGGGGTNAILFQAGSYSTYQAGVGGGSPGGGNIAFSGVVGSTGESTGSTGAYPGGGGGGGINERGGYGADGLVLIEY